MPLASVYPLVTARALARPFTYEVGEDVEPGSVVEVALHGARRRGVVVSLDEEAPPGVEPALAGPVVDRLPAPLVELALWLAEYYGSTPARALQLVAPVQRRRRGERAEPAAREALAGEAEAERPGGGPRGAPGRGP